MVVVTSTVVVSVMAVGQSDSMVVGMAGAAPVTMAVTVMASALWPRAWNLCARCCLRSLW